MKEKVQPMQFFPLFVKILWVFFVSQLFTGNSFAKRDSQIYNEWHDPMEAVQKLLGKRMKHTFDRRLLSSCGWSLTTSPSCWAAAFLVTGVVPVSSRINRRSSLQNTHTHTESTETLQRMHSKQHETSNFLVRLLYFSMLYCTKITSNL